MSQCPTLSGRVLQPDYFKYNTTSRATSSGFLKVADINLLKISRYTWKLFKRWYGSWLKSFYFPIGRRWLFIHEIQERSIMFQTLEILLNAVRFDGNGITPPPFHIDINAALFCVQMLPFSSKRAYSSTAACTLSRSTNLHRHHCKRAWQWHSLMKTEDRMAAIDALETVATIDCILETLSAFSQIVTCFSSYFLNFLSHFYFFRVLILLVVACILQLDKLRTVENFLPSCFMEIVLFLL